MYWVDSMFLWRGEDGVAHLFDAHCPHLGANMGFGGEVNGNCLRCPFHGWEYDGSGACTKVPYANEPNKFAKAAVYKIIERNQIIYFWHDAEHRDPWWEPPSFPELDNCEFTYHGKTEHHVLAHIQELPENGADISHLNTLHHSATRGITHQWEATWVPLGESTEKSATADNNNNTTKTTNLSHWTEIRLTERTILFGIPLKFLDVKVVVNQIGPGIVWLRFFTPFGQALVLESTTPYGPMVQRTFHFIFAAKTIPRWMAKIMLYSLGKFYEQDIMIWQWKTFPAKPILNKEDATIQKFRKWFSQFYSEHSLPFDEAVKTYAKGAAAAPMDW